MRPFRIENLERREMMTAAPLVDEPFEPNARASQDSGLEYSVATGEGAWGEVESSVQPVIRGERSSSGDIDPADGLGGDVLFDVFGSAISGDADGKGTETLHQNQGANRLGDFVRPVNNLDGWQYSRERSFRDFDSSDGPRGDILFVVANDANTNSTSHARQRQQVFEQDKNKEGGIVLTADRLDALFSELESVL